VGASDQFIEQLTDRGYDGVTALAYDAWLPPGSRFPDDGWYLRMLEQIQTGQGNGTALELGTGNGRFLIPARRRGFDVEGIDSSADMLERCRRHAATAGLDVTLHHGDIAPLALGRTYQAIICPAGTFTLIADLDRAHQALASYREHLVPGAGLAFSCHTERRGDTTGFAWRLRRTATAVDTGITYVAHEATGADDAAGAEQVHLSFSRVETYDRDGRLLDTWFRRIRLRWWTRDQMQEALTDAGFDRIEFLGDDHDWLVSARAV
jgi:SAM-dependent methyltransferase